MKTKLGSDIRIIRLQRNLSQEDVAELLGVKQQTVGTWERTGEIPSGRWKQIKEVFGVDPAQYVQGGKNVIADQIHKSNIATGNMEVTNNKFSHDFSEGEIYLIRSIRKKDPTGKLLDKVIGIVLAADSAE